MPVPPAPTGSASLGASYRVLVQGLAAYWDFANTGNLGLDETGNGLNLTNTGGVTAGSGPGGLPAAVFSGSSRLVLAAPASGLSFGAGVRATLACWVRLDAKATDQVMIGKYTGPGNLREYYLGYDHTLDRFVFVASPDGSAATQVAANTFGAPALSAWHFVAGVYDGAHLSISVDAGAADQAVYTGDLAATGAAFNLGAYDGGMLFLTGALAGAGLWRRALSAAEVAYLAAGRSYAAISGVVPGAPSSSAGVA